MFAGSRLLLPVPINFVTMTFLIPREGGIMPDKAVFVSSAALCTALPGESLLLQLQKRHLVAKNEFRIFIQIKKKTSGRAICNMKST